MDQKFKVRHHEVFKAWVKELGYSRNTQLHTVVTERLRSVREGKLGKHKSVGGRVSELIIDFGPGYRIYYTKRGREIILLLCAGDKSEQKKDIKLARTLVKEVQSEKEKYR